MLSAVEALGERVLRILGNCALDAALLGEQRSAFDKNVIPPYPEGNLLRIMSSSDVFEPFVLHRLHKAFGLPEEENAASTSALRSLAADFFGWARNQQEASTSFGLTVEDQTVYVRSEKPQPVGFRPLERFVPPPRERNVPFPAPPLAARMADEAE